MKKSPRLHNWKALKHRRRALRNDATTAEAVLWKMLRKSQLHGRKFRRQHSIGPYIVDFYCPSEQFIVELDGAAHDDPARADYDEKRNRYLIDHGFEIVQTRGQCAFQRHPAPVPELDEAIQRFCDDLGLSLLLGIGIVAGVCMILVFEEWLDVIATADAMETLGATIHRGGPDETWRVWGRGVGALVEVNCRSP